MSIGQLSKATGVKVVTIRYYEQVKLLPDPMRSAGNYRTYDETHVRCLRFIRRCRDLGFTLDQVRALLGLSTKKDHKCSEVNRITIEHLTEIRQKIADLTRLAKELSRISLSCRSDGPISNCRILEALSPDS